MRLGPDTTNNTLDLGYRHASGYNWVDDNIRAFSHTRLVNAGVSDLGNFGVMPTSRRSLREDLQEALKSHLWTSHYVKSSEKASPGKYSVYMDSIDVQAEMLAFDPFAGVHRYTWNPENKYGSSAAASIADNTAPGLVIDVCHAADEAMKNYGACMQSSFTLGKDRRSFSASVLFNGGLSGRGKDGGIRAYIHGELVLPKELGTDGVTALDWMICADDKNCHLDFRSEGTVQGQSGQLLAHVRFLNRPSSTPFSVELAVGISFISEAQAKDNLVGALTDAAVSRDTASSLYERLVTKSEKTWCDALGNVQFEDFASVSIPNPANRPEEKKDFLSIAYSAVYRTLLSPTQYSERNGYYLGMDNQVHNSINERSGLKSFGSNSFQYYSDLSLWDTFRTQHPWLLLTRPDVAVGTLRSMAEMSKQAGRFPKWVLGSVESGCMIGIHGMAAAVESIYAGYGDYIDIASMQTAALAQCTDPTKTDRNDLQRYLSDGYVSVESAENCASLTLSYAFDDHSLSVLSSFVGDTASAASALNRSMNNYRTIWSSSQEIMCPRSSTGELKCPSSSTGIQSWNYYTEGDPEHWRWFVPQDIEGLIGRNLTSFGE